MKDWIVVPQWNRTHSFSYCALQDIWQLRSQIAIYSSISGELLFCQLLWKKKEHELPSPTAEENRNLNSFVLPFSFFECMVLRLYFSLYLSFISTYDTLRKNSFEIMKLYKF